MKKMLIAALIGASVSGPAFALNDREQGILIGAIVASILNRQAMDTPPPRVVREVIREPIIVYPQPLQRMPSAPLCLSHPFHDQYGRFLGYTYSCH